VVSRSHAEVRAEGGEYVLHTSGATGTRLNGEHVSTPRQLREGDRIEIGTATLTFRRSRLPLGVSVVDRAEIQQLDDVLTKRTTISNPILGGHEPGERRNSLPVLLLSLVVVVMAIYYFVTR
jgi:pSer/pThr/pTyr-binding forkhead associated (FHA) protein